mmetsp:Transcript_18894/g.46394  ORF Transcript_18894/g.46394 Transcript_18894/m.46394 type:complete len:90 (+) Transcript_18894:1073-1342(+)
MLPSIGSNSDQENSEASTYYSMYFEFTTCRVHSKLSAHFKDRQEVDDEKGRQQCSKTVGTSKTNNSAPKSHGTCRQAAPKDAENKILPL